MMICLGDVKACFRFRLFSTRRHQKKKQSPAAAAAASAEEEPVQAERIQIVTWVNHSFVVQAHTLHTATSIHIRFIISRQAIVWRLGVLKVSCSLEMYVLNHCKSMYRYTDSRLLGTLRMMYSGTYQLEMGEGCWQYEII